MHRVAAKSIRLAIILLASVGLPIVACSAICWNEQRTLARIRDPGSSSVLLANDVLAAIQTGRLSVSDPGKYSMDKLHRMLWTISKTKTCEIADARDAFFDEDYNISSRTFIIVVMDLLTRSDDVKRGEFFEFMDLYISKPGSMNPRGKDDILEFHLILLQDERDIVSSGLRRFIVDNLARIESHLERPAIGGDKRES